MYIVKNRIGLDLVPWCWCVRFARFCPSRWGLFTASMGEGFGVNLRDLGSGMGEENTCDLGGDSIWFVWMDGSVVTMVSLPMRAIFLLNFFSLFRRVI